MSALEIVLVCVLSVVVFTIVLIFFIQKYSKKFFKNQKNDFIIMDRNIKKGTSVIVGDSLTDFFQINEFIDDCKIKNRGIAEDTTDDLIERIDEIKEIKSHNIYLQIGINDIIQKGKKLEPMALAEKIVSIADIFKENESNVYIISLYPINRKKMMFSPYFCGQATNERINKVNEALKNVCDEKEYIYINVHDSLCDEKGSLKIEYTLEGLHLTALAYEQIMKIIKEYF